MKRLEDYAELLEAFGEDSQAVLQSNWQEAARVFSPLGLDQYLDGAMGMRSLGKGDGLVSSYLDSAPQVAREVGEDAVWELVSAVMKMASKTSGAVLEAVVSTSPTAANRLADLELFKSYLGMLDRLLAQVPRAVRPMLEHIDQLFGYLTLGGLRRWALWGAHAHRTDFEAQIAYFSLKSPEALAMLQQERKGTLFVDIQRRLRMYLRALWGRDFFLRPTSGDFEDREGYRPFIEGIFIHIPDAYDDWEGIDGMTRYRAVAAHAAAHVAYLPRAISAEALNPEQMAVIGLLEDARVEALAMRAFPGIRAIWLPFHTAIAGPVASLGHLFSRLARAMIDPAYQDDHPWVREGRQAFLEAEERWEDPQLSWDLGVRLAHSLRKEGIPFHARTDIPDIPYRDDNRYIWEFEEVDWENEATILPGAQVRKYVNVMEMVNEVDTELAGDDAQEVWVLQSELFPYEDMGLSYNQMEGKEPVSDPYHYPEWDYQIQTSRPHWATVLERRPRVGDRSIVREVLDKYKPVSSRLKYLIEALQPQGVQRLRKQEDGDEIDLEAAVRALVDIRMGLAPDTRIHLRNLRKVRDLGVLVLMDLSESTNDTVYGSEDTVLQLTRDATSLLADAMHRIGDPFAIHGFHSDGRHDVAYYRFKDFDEAYGDVAMGRIAGMTGKLSTRMGAALRHAGHYLRQQRQSKKLLLVITDGEPADIDVRDPQYLRYDAKRAVEELGRDGVITYCLSLDPHADEYVSRIFGARNYQVIDHVERLPERLPMLYAGLTQ